VSIRLWIPSAFNACLITLCFRKFAAISRIEARSTRSKANMAEEDLVGFISFLILSTLMVESCLRDLSLFSESRSDGQEEEGQKDKNCAGGGRNIGQAAE
jgi:hypothetical protein